MNSTKNNHDLDKNFKININCKYYLGYKPCVFHKMDGRLCFDCADYEQIAHRILIIKLEAVGDVLRTTSILPALLKKYPNSSVTWITRKKCLPVLENNPYIARKYAIEDNAIHLILNERFDSGICLDAEHYSAAILTVSKCTSKYGFLVNDAGQLMPASHDAEKWYLMGLNDELKKNNKETYQKIIYDICKLPEPIEKPQLYLNDNSIRDANHFALKHSLKHFKKVIGINTGGGHRWQMKKWLYDYYIEFIKLFNARHPDIGLLLFGGPEEIEYNKTIIRNAPPGLIDTGCGNNIMAFAGLISLIDVFLTPDTLGMHIATALNKTTIVLVGPTSPWELDVHEKGEIVYDRDIGCICCYLSSCNKIINCMSTLTPEHIYKIVQKYL